MAFIGMLYSINFHCHRAPLVFAKKIGRPKGVAKTSSEPYK
jgi:hypothetical protein